MNTSTTTTAIIMGRLNFLDQELQKAITNNLDTKEALIKEKDILNATLSTLLGADDDSDDEEPPSEEPSTRRVRILAPTDAAEEAREIVKNLRMKIKLFTEKPEFRDVVNGQRVDVDNLLADLRIAQAQLARIEKSS